MVYYLVRLQHHHIVPEYGTWDDSDPYDHYLGDMHEQTNLRYVIVNDEELNTLANDFIPDDPFNYESVNVMYEFHYEYEMRRFINCMRKIEIGGV
jgi:hypothetical protein